MTAAMTDAYEINLDSLGTPDLDLQRQSWEVPSRESWRVENRFRQTNLRAKTSTLFQRFNQHYLLIQGHKKTKELPEKVLDLTFVEPQPREVIDNQLKLWGAAVAVMALPALALYLLPVSLLWLAVPLGLSLLLAALANRWRRHCYEFFALNSDVVLFTIDARGTDEKKASAFVEILGHAIAYSQRQLPDGKRRIPFAVAEMRRLSDQNIITKEQYEQIKRNWFGF